MEKQQPQQLKLICSEYIATRRDNENTLRLFRKLFLSRAELPEYKILLTLDEWDKEFKKIIK